MKVLFLILFYLLLKEEISAEFVNITIRSGNYHFHGDKYEPGEYILKYDISVSNYGSIYLLDEGNLNDDYLLDIQDYYLCCSILNQSRLVFDKPIKFREYFYLILLPESDISTFTGDIQCYTKETVLIEVEASGSIGLFVGVIVVSIIAFLLIGAIVGFIIYKKKTTSRFIPPKDLHASINVS